MMKTAFRDTVQANNQGPLTARGIEVLQVNMGYRCNMVCTHCHVQAGPGRTEAMDRETVDAVLRVLKDNPVKTLDITGGAPEMNPFSRRIITEANKLGKHIISRTNLTIFCEEGMRDFPEFYRDQGVELIASLPCYLENNVNASRGIGAFQQSIDALRRLNSLGYGDEAGELRLHLVYNPAGPFLAPAQSTLERDYKRELSSRHGVVFNRLFVFANMPIGRFRDSLVKSNDLGAYLALLASSFNPHTLDRIMCRSLVSVGWDGRLSDCDFNQVLGIATEAGISQHISDFDYAALSRRRISVDDHCFGCTAGQGST